MSGNRRHKLELTWIGKEHRPRLEPRILLEDPDKSYHAPHRITDHDIFDNRLIFGDNLLALKALEQEFMGKIKCIFIDPPYNTVAPQLTVVTRTSASSPVAVPVRVAHAARVVSSVAVGHETPAVPGR